MICLAFYGVTSCCQEAWQSRRICETLKTPEELKEKKASIQVLADVGTVVKTSFIFWTFGEIANSGTLESSLQDPQGRKEKES